MEESKDLIICNHSDELVSRATYKRHNRKRKVQLSTCSFLVKSGNRQPDTDSDSDTYGVLIDAGKNLLFMCW